MDNLTPVKASRNILDSYTVKADLATEWSYADAYYNNTINSLENFGEDITKLVTWNTSWHIRQDHFDNNIPQLMRTYAAWVVNQPFDILSSPQGSKNDYFHQLISQANQDCLNYFISRPKFLADLREIAIRMKAYNAVAQVDYYDWMREEPASRLIPHTDIFLDPTARFPINDTGGPRWVAVRLLLYPDEAINRYGRDKVARMQQGLVNISEDPGARTRNPNYYSHLYDIYEMYGYDYTLVAVPAQETRDTAVQELSEWINSPSEVEPEPVDPDIDHEMAVNEGIRLMHVVMDEKAPSDVSLETTLYKLQDYGLGRIADAFAGWVQEHLSYIEDGDAGGSRPKYDDFVYKAEFQYGNMEWLKEPEELDYPHGQIPVSFYRNHVNTEGLFGAGPFTEVMNIHRRLEKYEDAQYTYVDIAARPPLIIDLDLLHPSYADDETKSGIIQALKEGFKTLFVRSSMAQGAHKPEFLKMPTMSVDTYRVIEYLRYRIQDIIGPTREMRGDVSGEVSGKAFQLRQQAAAKPVTDILLQIEGPIQQHLERMSSLILAYLPYEKIANISGQENADAVQEFRDRDECPRCATQVRFGRGMPTDWETKAGWGTQMFDRGLIDVKSLEKITDSPVELNPPPMPAAAPGQGAPAGGPAQGGNPMTQGVSR